MLSIAFFICFLSALLSTTKISLFSDSISLMDFSVDNGYFIISYVPIGFFGFSAFVFILAQKQPLLFKQLYCFVSPQSSPSHACAWRKQHSIKFFNLYSIDPRYIPRGINKFAISGDNYQRAFFDKVFPAPHLAFSAPYLFF